LHEHKLQYELPFPDSSIIEHYNVNFSTGLSMKNLFYNTLHLDPQEQISIWNLQFAAFTPEEVIIWALQHFGNKIAFSTSMGAEDQAILHMIAAIDKTANVFTLDTGRLFPETYDLIDISSKKYEIPIRMFSPDTQQVENMVNEKGINLFYESIANRKLCCHIRKIEPLKRAFSGLDAWICGLRKEQSVTRNCANLFEWDKQFNLIKINPLIHWTEDQLWDYLKRNNVPYNRLHDKGYPSIGCQPCTRAIEPGEDVRAGRWWWEHPETKECGLHVAKQK
jgi:phosphoadenosine phosphosulfate reductase